MAAHDDLPKGLTIRVSSTGTSSFRFSYRHNGRRHRPTLDGLNPNNRQQRAHAIRLAESFHTAKKIPGFDPAAFFPDEHGKRPGATSTTTVGEALQDYIKRCAGTHKNTTLRGMRQAAGAFTRGPAAIADVRLSELTPAHLRAFISASTISKPSMATYFKPLRAVIAEALEDGAMQSNPLTAKTVSDRLKGMRRVESKIDPFNDGEIVTLCDAARLQSDALANMIVFGFHSGLRLGELFALLWEDIDFRHGIVHVDKAVAEGVLGAPKTAKSIRDVLLRETAIATLKAQKTNTRLRPEGVVFINPSNNKPFRFVKDLHRLWRPAIERAGLAYRNPYQMRHTYISQMLRAGEDPAFIARQVRHSNLVMLNTVYAKYIDEGRGGAGIHQWRGGYGAA
jgi:integrase